MTDHRIVLSNMSHWKRVLGIQITTNQIIQWYVIYSIIKGRSIKGTQRHCSRENKQKPHTPRHHTRKLPKPRCKYLATKIMKPPNERNTHYRWKYFFSKENGQCQLHRIRIIFFICILMQNFCLWFRKTKWWFQPFKDLGLLFYQNCMNIN